jgi:hypothetical protein
MQPPISSKQQNLYSNDHARIFEALNFDQWRLRTYSPLATALSSLAAKSVSLSDREFTCWPSASREMSVPVPISASELHVAWPLNLYP